MPSRRPQLDLTPPDKCRQVAEFCAEFPHYRYEDIATACQAVESAVTALRQRGRTTFPAARP